MEGIEIKDENHMNIESELMKQQDETLVNTSDSTSDSTSNSTGDSASENTVQDISELLNSNSNTHILENINDDDFDEFKENAINYFTLDDEISTLNKKLRELRKQKNDCTKNLIEFMGDNKIKDINTDSGKLKYVVTTQKERVNNKYIKKKLMSYFNSDDKALECFKHIDNREKVEIPKLKRVKN
jgi:hypothetical protein